MTTLLSLDGGNRKDNGRACYVAIYKGGALGMVLPVTLAQARGTTMRGADAVAVERPAFDGRIQRGVPPGTIIDLAWNAAAVAYTLAKGCPVHEYTPTVWIGTVAKPVLHQRIWAALTDAERRCFGESTLRDLDSASEHYAKTRKIKQHAAFNTLDAAGVGLFHLGRIKKGGAKP